MPSRSSRESEPSARSRCSASRTEAGRRTPRRTTFASSCDELGETLAKDAGGLRDPRPDGGVGLLGAVSIGIGGMVGGGIFAVLGLAAKEAGGATPLAFLLAGIVAALTAYTYSRLSVHFRSAGGTVTFIDRIFGVSGFTGALNVVLWAGYVATTALYVSAFANYTATFFPGGTDPPGLMIRLLILLGLAIPWLVNLSNAGVVARAEEAIVLLKLTILAVVIVAGVPSVSTERLAASTWPSIGAIAASGMLIFVAYEGFELIANASSDIRQPRRTLPWAFAISVGSVVIVYVAISAVVVGSLSADEISNSADFALAEAAAATLGQIGFTMVAVSAMLATLSATNATLYGAARLSFTLASEGELPSGFEQKKWSQPVGLHLTAFVAALIAVVLPLDSISTIASAVFLIVFAVVNAAGFKAADTAGVRRSIATLGVLGCLAALVALMARAISEDLVSVVGLAVLLAAALLGESLLMGRRRPVRTDGGRRMILP